MGVDNGCGQRVWTTIDQMVVVVPDDTTSMSRCMCSQRTLRTRCILGTDLEDESDSEGIGWKCEPGPPLSPLPSSGD